MEVTIEGMTGLPPDLIAPLVAESEQEGWRFVRRLNDEWITGSCRFDRPGEKFFAARSGSLVVGVCGLNIDPYASHPTIGRVRRLYVLRANRGQGIGTRLVEAVIQAARGQFRFLRVRTENSQAGGLYKRLGFESVANLADCTHVLRLETALGNEVEDGRR